MHNVSPKRTKFGKL